MILYWIILHWLGYLLIGLLGYSRPWRATASGHRLRLGLHRSLICFATLAFVPQRQEKPRCLPSPLVFQLISTHFIATLAVPASLSILNHSSIVSIPKVEPWYLKYDLLRSLRTLYAQWIRITLASYVLPRLLATKFCLQIEWTSL